MRILILGASGLAGAEIRRTLDTPGNLVYGSCRNPAGAAGLCRYDLDGPGDLEAVLEETRPEAIVSCLRGDYEKQLEAHRTAGDYLAGRGGRMVYLSTANVFDGETDRPHYEDDPPKAESDYGRFKIACERLLAERLGEKLAVLRLPEIWGRSAPRLRALKEADRTAGTAPVYDNIRINFTTDRQAAKWTEYILQQNLGGIFHAGTRDERTHGAFRRQLAKALGLEGIRWEANLSEGCQSILPGRREIPEELHISVDGVLDWLAG